MQEGEDGGPDCSIPGDRPVSSTLNNFCGFDCSERNLDVTKFLNFRIIVGGRELSAEHCIKVDCPSCDDILPLGVGKFWAIGFINEGPLGRFGVECVDLDELESLREGVS